MADSTSWEDIWKGGLKKGQRFDAGESAPALKELVKGGSLPEGKALVPGCGRGYDVETLASDKRFTVGLELAPTAAKAAEAELKERGLPASTYEIKSGDFFEHTGTYDVIYDYTFFCAIPPSLRKSWGKQIASLLSPTGTLVTLMFPLKPYTSKRATGPEPIHEHDQDYSKGPPYLLKPEFYKEVLEPHGLECVSMEEPKQSHSGREGMELVGIWKFKKEEQPIIV